MRIHATTRITAVLLVAVSLVLPAAAAADVQQDTIQLSSTFLHPGETLFVAAGLDATGSVSSLTFVFQGNSSGQIVNVTDNLTLLNGTTYRVQHMFDGSEANDSYALQYVEACDDSGCAVDSTNLTTPTGKTPSFILAPVPPSLPDLVATGISASGNATPGSSLFLMGDYANWGDATASGFYVSLSVDNATVARDFVGSFAPGATGTIYASWTATAGFHTIRLSVDVNGSVNESNEANNVLAHTILVLPPRADVGVDITGITHERLQTEAGGLPHPLPRHTIHLTVTNDADEAVTASVYLRWAAQMRIAPLNSSGSIGAASVLVPAHGSATLDYVWDPVGVIGDVTVHADVFPVGRSDPNPANNHDSMADFVIVGGLGGI